MTKAYSFDDIADANREALAAVRDAAIAAGRKTLTDYGVGVSVVDSLPLADLYRTMIEAAVSEMERVDRPAGDMMSAFDSYDPGWSSYTEKACEVIRASLGIEKE